MWGFFLHHIKEIHSRKDNDVISFPSKFMDPLNSNHKLQVTNPIYSRSLCS